MEDGDGDGYCKQYFQNGNLQKAKCYMEGVSIKLVNG